MNELETLRRVRENVPAPEAAARRAASAPWSGPLADVIDRRRAPRARR